MLFDNQRLMGNNFQALGFFDSLNIDLQPTASSVRSCLAPASSGSSPPALSRPVPTMRAGVHSGEPGELGIIEATPKVKKDQQLEPQSVSETVSLEESIR
jgi:hypothetical protein